MERYRRLVESAPDGILIVQGERITFVNPAAVRLFGVRDSSQLLGGAFIELFAADCREHVREQCLPPVDGRSLRSVDDPPRSVDTRIVAPDGTVRDLQLTRATIDVDGAPAVEVIARDVTERKTAERALRESEERLSLAVDGAQEGVWDWNLETNAVVYSARWKQMLGYSEEEIEPHVSAWERLAHPDDRARADRANESVARGSARPTKPNSGCATKTATTCTCCRADFPCAVNRAARSSASSAPISISRIAESAPKRRCARTKSD